MPSIITVNGYGGVVVRSKSPEGKRVVIGIRVSEATAEGVDAARGGRSRSEWVQDLVVDALSETVNGNAGAENKRLREGGSCPPHPRGRVIKGFCYRCGKPAA